MLSDEEAMKHISTEKEFVDISTIVLDSKNRKQERRLKSTCDEYLFNISSGRIELSKMTYMTRHAKSNTILVRIDTSSGARHINPDGEFIPCPHIHIYKDGSTKWAYPLDHKMFNGIFTKTDDVAILLKDLFKYINIKKNPRIFYVPELV